MKRTLIALWISAACLILGSGSDPGRAQHSGAHSTPSRGAASPQPGPANAVVEFENESIVVVRIRMAPGEKTPMHDITSARLVVWLTDAHLRDTHSDGSTKRRIATRGTSTGSACNGTRARISRMRRWNFWRSCPRQVGRPPRPNSSRAANRLSRSASQLGTRSDAPFADKTHVRPPPSRPKQNHIVFFGLAALHPGRADRHAGNGKAGCIRFLGKEELQRGDRDVPLDDITRDLCGVAGGEIVWNAEPFLHRIDVVGVEYLGDETRLLKMLDPT